MGANLVEAAQALVAYGLTVQREGGVVWDSNCRGGEITTVLRRAGVDVLATSLEANWFDCQGERDFLEVPEVDEKVELVITSPPAALRKDFVEHALALMEKNQGGVLMFMPFGVNLMNTTRHLFEQWPFVARLRMRNPEASWFYWDWRYRGPCRGVIRIED